MLRSFLLIFFSICVYMQTYAQQQYEGFESKSSSYYLGYMTSKITKPEIKLPYYYNIPAQEFKQSGILFSYTSRLGKIGNSVIGPNDQIEFCFNGGTRIGFGYGETEINSPDYPSYPYHTYPKITAKYYFALLDFYSFDFGIEYSHVFNNGSALLIKFAYNFFNIGASLATPDGGKIEEDGILNANIFPLIFKPSIQYDFGKSALGLTFLFDAGNLFGFGYTKEGLFNNEYRGFNSKTLFSKFAVLLTYSL